MSGLSFRAAGMTLLALAVAAAGILSLAPSATAEEPANDAFERSWARTDLPVSDLVISRTWIWGPEAFTDGVMEPYAEAEGGQRLVQYFDKSRKELNTDPNVPQDSPWYVVNGLLATEMITGRVQLGDNTFQQHSPAEINIAGDVTDQNAPTYATFNGLLDQPTYEVGTLIGTTVNRAGTIDQNPSLLDYGVTAEAFVLETEHTVASVFWDFMISQGTIYVDGNYTWGQLFQDAYAATGLPITEAYWTSVQVDGEPRDVLVQAFERRVLTYTPSNPEGWRVEAGNVGRHYFDWRYSTTGESPPPQVPTLPGTPISPEPPSEPTPAPMPSADRGLVGSPGTSSLGQTEYSQHSAPYLDVEVGDQDEIGWTVATRRSPATLNQQFTISLVNNTKTPSEKIFYVLDFNDGSIFVSPVMKSNVGLNVTHVFRGRDTFYPKAWSIDPITGIRAQITTWTLEVK